MANQSVGVPRFYLDYTQLAKAKGFWRDPLEFGDTNTEGLANEYSGEGSYNSDPENMNVWNFDYTNPTEYKSIAVGDGINVFYLNFWDEDNEDKYSLEWAKLLQTANWGGLINHSIYSGTLEQGQGEGNEVNAFYTNGDDKNLWVGDSSTTGGGTGKEIEYDGYTIFTSTITNDHVFSDLSMYSKIGFEIDMSGDFVFGDFTWFPNLTYKLGAIAFGKYIDMPHSPDLKVNKSIEFDGISMQRSLGGADYVQINNLGSPDWINGEPWSLSKYNSQGRVGKNGRRRWELNFSYISNDDLFYDITKSNITGDEGLDANGDPSTFYATNEIQQIWDLTLGGSLPFVFTPNKDADNVEYCTCRLDQGSFKATQVASQCWNVSMNIVEVW